MTGTTDYFDDERDVQACQYLGEEVLLTWSRRMPKPGRVVKPQPRRARWLICDFGGGSVEGVVVDHEVFEWGCPRCARTNYLDVTAEYDPDEREDLDPYELAELRSGALYGLGD